MKSIAAAFIFFTRLPFWRLFSPPKEAYRNVIHYWSVTGWLTATVMAGVLWAAAQVLPVMLAVLLAMLSRVLLTGALHEDGLADFFDGFGAGGSRERILGIMKDSHIGTYGVISLVFYFGLLAFALYSLPLSLACMTILAGDPLCKFIASHITALPYARPESESKSLNVYDRYKPLAFIVSALFGLIPLLYLLEMPFWLAAALPLLVFGVLLLLMKKKLNGYTGDCCGAMFLLCELSFYIGVVVISGLL